MSFYEKIIYQKLRELHRHNCVGAVKTRLLADHLNKNDRTMRMYLARMEEKGVVQRRGVRGGWLPVYN